MLYLDDRLHCIYVSIDYSNIEDDDNYEETYDRFLVKFYVRYRLMD